MVSCTVRRCARARFAHVTEKIGPVAHHVKRALRQIVLPYSGKTRASPGAAWMQQSSDMLSPDVVLVPHLSCWERQAEGVDQGTERGEAGLDRLDMRR